ncbi:hypothetical protein GCM10023216_10540 [Isoptericola chiayiensis]|uniref:PepSY domain-containing protein n=1 Tax=Isoptericola chiayiensis TaxID=579446 RepID=A0ABP8Y6R9_9MICO|nr:PepSY domain-containing protein [Isoptericola chiayiensis]NOW00691.1 putative membrane protein YkoI [Isoptericola chiayiensis]
MTPRLTRSAGMPALALAAVLALSGCTGDDDATPGEAVTLPSASESADEPTAEESSAEDGAADDDGSDDGGADDDGADDSDGGAGGAGGDDSAPTDRTTTGLSAIALAEAETGGAAYALDDEDGGWQVDVADGDRSVEVTTNAAGTEVTGTESGDLDGEDRDALDATQVSLSEAVQRVVGQSGGALQDAELDVDDGAAHWSVGVTLPDGGDQDFTVSLETGEVSQDDD